MGKQNTTNANYSDLNLSGKRGTYSLKLVLYSHNRLLMSILIKISMSNKIIVKRGCELTISILQSSSSSYLFLSLSLTELAMNVNVLLYYQFSDTRNTRRCVFYLLLWILNYSPSLQLHRSVVSISTPPLYRTCVSFLWLAFFLNNLCLIPGSGVLWNN